MAAQQQQPLQLPAPQLFDILPTLHEILARIDHSTTSTNDLLTQAPLTTPSTSDLAHYPDLQPLDPKDLPTAILPLKALMRKGLREVEKLPEMERSVQEQEEEIEELEDRIRRQDEVLRGLAEVARGVEGRVVDGGPARAEIATLGTPDNTSDCARAITYANTSRSIWYRTTFGMDDLMAAFGTTPTRTPSPSALPTSSTPAQGLHFSELGSNHQSANVFSKHGNFVASELMCHTHISAQSALFVSRHAALPAAVADLAAMTDDMFPRNSVNHVTRDVGDEEWGAWVDGDHADHEANPIVYNQQGQGDTTLFDQDQVVNDFERVAEGEQGNELTEVTVSKPSLALDERYDSGLYLNPWSEDTAMQPAKEQGVSGVTVRSPSDKAAAATAAALQGRHGLASRPWSTTAETCESTTAVGENEGLHERQYCARSRTPSNPWESDVGPAEATSQHKPVDEYIKCVTNPWHDAPAEDYLKAGLRHTNTTLTTLEQEDYISMRTDSLDSILFVKALAPDAAQRALISKQAPLYARGRQRFRVLRSGDGEKVEAREGNGQGASDSRHHHWWQRRLSQKKVRDKGQVEG